MNYLLMIVLVSGIVFIIASAGADRHGAPEIKELSRLTFFAGLLAYLLK